MVLRGDFMAQKQVLVIRKDLNMRKGKIAAQASHASLKVFFDKIRITTVDDITRATFTIDTVEELKWIGGSFTKIAVGANSEQELLDIYNKAKEANLLCSLVLDEGRTEFKGVPTYTVVAIGPADSDGIDKITGVLSLL